MTIAEEFQARRERLYDKWRVTLQFVTPVHGGIPAFGSTPEDQEKDKNILRAWLTKNMPDATEEAIEELVEQTAEEAYKDAEAKASTTFKCINGTICLEGRQVKAMLREAGSRLGLTKQVKGKRPSLKQELHEALYVDDQYIPLMRNGEPITEPDGYDVRPIHVMTAQGPRNSIKSSAYCSPDNGQVALSFTVRILDRAVLGEEELKDLLAFAQDLALGADRSQDCGKLAIIGFEQIQKAEG